MQTRPTPLKDPRLSVIQGGLTPAEPSPFPATGEGIRAHAAVSLILRGGPELDILLIRRAKAEGDPWSGHIALPGGRREGGDRDLLHTAMRETMEETGVHLQARGVPLGRLGTVEPSTARLPLIAIHPFVFGVPEDTGAHAASREVDGVLWTPLSHFLDRSTHGTVEIPLGDVTRTFPCFHLEKGVIWGLTYRIFTNFLEAMEASEVQT